MPITSTDKYRIVGKVGTGGMGIVYHAVQTRLDREVAVKVLKPRYARDPGFVQRFRQEARALAALPHTHIVQIYDVERVGDDLWIIMEWVDGRTLREVLKAEGPLPWERTLALVRQCAAALAAAHDAGVLHRDVKPENILLTADDTVKMMDFGVAMFLDPERNVASESGVGVGSPRYMAPEQLAGEHADARADQYALALVAFELCTGDFPFPGSDIYAIGYEKLHRDPLRLRDFWDEAPAHADEALALALSRDPTGRFDGMRAFIEALDPPPPRKLPLTPFAAGAFVMLCLLGAAFYVLQPEPPPKPPPPRVEPNPIPEPRVPVTALAPLPAAVPEPEPDPVVPLVAALDVALVQEDYVTAEHLVEEIFSHEPDHPRARNAQQQIHVARAQEQLLADAIALYDHGARREAKGMFRALLTARPDHPQAQEYIARIERTERVAALLAAAREARAERELANAKQAYRDVLALAPDQGEAKQALQEIAAEEERAAQLAAAEQALAAGDFATARTIYQLIQAATPDNLGAARGLARLETIERDRDQFDAAAFAAELRARSQGLAESVEALTEAVAEQERSADDPTIRHAARATRSALRTYGRQVQDPLEQLARSVDAAGAELAAFSGRLEKVSGRYFASAVDKQHNQRDRLTRSVDTMSEALEAEGRALTAGPERLTQRIRARLAGGGPAEPVNRNVLVYRRPRSFFARGEPGPLDPMAEVIGELAPLQHALETLVSETVRVAGTDASPVAAAIANVIRDTHTQEWAGIANRLEALNTAQQRRSERGTAADTALTQRLTEVRSTLDRLAARVTERQQGALSEWTASLERESTRHAAHFASADYRTQQVATRLTVEVSEITADISRQLADQQRASDTRLRSATTERAWLTEQAVALAALTTPDDVLAGLKRLAAEVPERGAARRAEYSSVHAEFAALARAAQDRMAAYRRARTGVLKGHVNTLQQQVRNTAGRIDTWEEAQSDTLRQAAEDMRTAAAAVDDAVDTWAESVSRVRARFGQQSRSAFAELQDDIERAVEDVEETQTECARLLAQVQREPPENHEALWDAARARVAELAQYVRAVGAGLERYNKSLDAAAAEALARRTEATDGLVEALGTGGATLRTVADTFAAAGATRVEELDGALAALIEESTAAIEAFESEAAAITPEVPAAETTASG